MPTQYRIIIQNDHKQDGNYAVFNTPPTVTPDPTSPEVYSNAWITQMIPEQGYFSISIKKNFYAWAGTTTSNPAPGVIVSGGVSQPAELGSSAGPGSDYPMTVIEGVPKLGDETLDSEPGSFKITTDTSFSMPNTTYLIGLGQQNEMGIVVPSACTLANNNAVTAITPIMKFYVTSSNYVEGEIVDYQTYTKNSGKVDFSSGEGLSKHTAVVHHMPNGSFQTFYFTGPQTAQVLLAATSGNLTSLLASVETRSQGGKKAQLRQVIKNLSELLDSFDNESTNVANALQWQYLARMGWPLATTAIVMTTGAAMTLSYMASLGYQTDFYEETLSPDGTKKIRSYKLRKRDGQNNFASNATPPPPLKQVERDWSTAVKRDTQNDGHTDEGVKPWRLALTQDNDVDEAGWNGTGRRVLNGDATMGHQSGNGYDYALQHSYQASQQDGAMTQIPIKARTAGVY